MSITSILFLLIVIVLILFAMTVIKKYKIESTKLTKTGSGPMKEYKTNTSIIRGTIEPSEPSSVNTNKYPKKLAQRLTDAGWKLYIKQTCPWCHLQIDMFGDDKKFLNIIDCSDEDLRPEELANCKQTWVYPTWANDTNIMPGSQTFKKLNKALKKKSKTMTIKEYQRLKEQ